MVIRKQSEMINLLKLGFFNQIIVAIIVARRNKKELHGISLRELLKRCYIMNGGIEAVNTPF
jgi:hypothetical protein